MSDLDDDITALAKRLAEPGFEDGASLGGWSVDENGVVSVFDASGELRIQMSGAAFVEFRRQYGDPESV